MTGAGLMLAPEVAFSGAITPVERYLFSTVTHGDPAIQQIWMNMLGFRQFGQHKIHRAQGFSIMQPDWMGHVELQLHNNLRPIKSAYSGDDTVVYVGVRFIVDEFTQKLFGRWVVENLAGRDIDNMNAVEVGCTPVEFYNWAKVQNTDAMHRLVSNANEDLNLKRNTR